MGTRCIAWMIAGIVWCAAGQAYADPKAEIAAKARSAMTSYDSMDYEMARRLLNQALAIAKKAKLDRDPIVARVYLELGIAQLAGSDQEAAKVAFLSAAQIDPKITIDPAYKSPELVRLLDEAKAAAADSAVDAGDSGECRSVRGLQHAVVDSGRAGAAQPLEAMIGSELAPAKVVAMVRPEGAIDFTEIKLTRQGACRYTGAIPAAAMRGSVVHYYIVAYDANNRALAAKGSSGAPNAVALGGGRTAAADPEDPIAGGGKKPAGGGDSAGEVRAETSRATTGGPPRVTLAVAGGTGLGYVTGLTEGGNKVQSCCVGTSLVVITPELAYRATARQSIGIAVRLGLPLGANVMGHATIAPGVFLRLRHVFSDSGEGLRVMAEVGGGFLRNTIKLDTMTPGMDTDIVAQGPLLLGAGLGYTKRIAGSVAFFVDLDAMAGLAVVSKLGSATRLNSGVSGDMTLGFAIGF